MIVRIELAPGEMDRHHLTNAVREIASRTQGVHLDFVDVQRTGFEPHYLDSLARFGWSYLPDGYLDRNSDRLKEIARQDAELRRNGWKPRSEFCYPKRRLADALNKGVES